MVHRLLLFAVVSHLTCSAAAAADGDDMPLSLWQKANLHKAIQIINLPGVLTMPMVTKSKLIWNSAERTLMVRTALVVHSDNKVADIFAGHVVAAPDFLFTPWRKQACSEIMSMQNSNNAQVEQQEDAMRPTVLASITLKRTQDDAWPRYLIYTESLRRISRMAFTEHDEQPTIDLLCITPTGAACLSNLPTLKVLIMNGELEKAELSWINTMLVRKQLGIKIDYTVLNEAYNDLFLAPSVQE
jgi:hypothetical protein